MTLMKVAIIIEIPYSVLLMRPLIEKTFLNITI